MMYGMLNNEMRHHFKDWLYDHGLENISPELVYDSMRKCQEHDILFQEIKRLCFEYHVGVPNFIKELEEEVNPLYVAKLNLERNSEILGKWEYFHNESSMKSLLKDVIDDNLRIVRFLESRFPF